MIFLWSDIRVIGSCIVPFHSEQGSLFVKWGLNLRAGLSFPAFEITQ